MIACIDPGHTDLVWQLNEQRKEGAFCDVLLKISGLALPTHACVLSARSPYFKGLIYGERSTPPHLAGSPQEIDLVSSAKEGVMAEIGDDGDGLEVVKDLLDYIYTGKINVKEDTVDLVVRLAGIFMLDGLTGLIKSHVEATKTEQPESEPNEVIPAQLPTKSKRVVTLSVSRERKTLPAALQVGPAAIIEEPQGLRIRKREQSNNPPAASDEDEDYWTTPDEDWSPSTEELSQSDDSELTADEEPTSSEDGDDEERRDKLSTKKEEEGAAAPTETAPSRRRRVRQTRQKREPVGTEPDAVPPAKKKKASKYLFKCKHKQCDFASGDAKAIRAHKLLHPGISHVCQTCGIFFTRGCKLLEHLLAATHPETKCSLCEFVADDPASFRQHLTRHDPQKPFLCHFCDFKCSSRCHLTEHAIKHSSDRPFVCGMCNAGFKWKNCLRKHMLTHSTEKNHMCDQCDFRTAHRSTLRLHLRVHSGEMLPCTYDGCTFQAYCKRNLQKHIFTHSKEKPYVCEVCGKKYAQEQSLKRHCRVHDPTAKLFHCDLCSFTTTRNDKLRQHTKKSHNFLDQQNSVASSNPAAVATDSADATKNVGWDRDSHQFSQPPPPHPPLPSHHHHHHHHHHSHREHHTKKTSHAYDQTSLQSSAPSGLTRTETEHKSAAVPMDREPRFHHFPPPHEQPAMTFMPSDISWAYSLPQ